MSGVDRKRRKALVEAYRKTPRLMGVYRREELDVLKALWLDNLGEVPLY